MSTKTFAHFAKEVTADTQKGMDLLTEVDELQAALRSQPLTKDHELLVQEIIEKEKKAVEFIQRATLTQRNLMKQQHDAIQRLIDKL